VIAIYAFNGGTTLKWPLESVTTEWFGKAIDNQGARDALWASVRVGAAATGVALVLGTLASFAVARYRFFGRETISFLVVLPLALPGIVTGVAPATPSPRLPGVDLSLFTVIAGYATLHRRRLQQRDGRLRRVSGTRGLNDLGGTCDLPAHRC
jgi:putative spermidine/putrescine transport system permease protein